ncbi:MAG: restriction endonuclease subunit R [Cyanophyceae cyanobacterium]
MLMTVLQARKLSLSDVHRLLSFPRKPGSLTFPLTLEPLSELEQRELNQIRNDFEHYVFEGKVSEGQVKLLTVAPLFRLAGFYQHPIKITLEENIERIVVEDEDTQIEGRLDILAVNKTRQTITDVPFWIIVIECKNSGVEALVGLPQLLTYAFQSLNHQKTIWGLATNGIRYQFVRIFSEASPVYQIMPAFSLIEAESSASLLQVLKAIALDVKS